MKLRMLIAGVALALGIRVASADGAAITDYVTFSASGFSSNGGPPPPTDPVFGSFLITFDPTQTYVNSTSGITLESLNLALGSPLSFDYSPTGIDLLGNVVVVNADELVVGGLGGGGAIYVGLQPPSNDFSFHINGFTSENPTFGRLLYGQVGADPNVGLFGYVENGPDVRVGTGAVSVTAVLEPATWVMMLLGFFGLGAVLRRRRASVALTA
ncbi:MAG: PEP-CTERM sorting domain-containing protein [Caulobacterales bacterium]